MNTEKSKPEKGYVLSWSDLRVVLKRSKKKIAYGAMAFALLASFFTLSRDVTYTAQGTFREKSKQPNSGEKSLSAILMTGGATAAESMAISTIKSRRVLEKVVLQLDFQAAIKPKENRNFFLEKISHYFSNIVNNIIVEEAYLSKKYKPVVKDPISPLLVKNVNYSGEIAATYELRFVDENHFKVYDIRGEVVGHGNLGEPVTLIDATFTIRKNLVSPISGQTYILSISPLSKVAQNLLANLVVEADKLDKTLLKINFHDIDRHRSSKFLNTIMQTYREFLVNEHVRVTEEQVAYLKHRQEDMDMQLVALMENHAVNIASNDSTIEFLVKTMQNYKSKLLNMDLEVKHLEKAQVEGISFFERHNADGESSVVQGLMSEIRKYRQQADTLEVALRNTHIHTPEVIQTTFNEYLDELQDIRQANKDARDLLANVDKGQFDPALNNLADNGRYLVKPWFEKIAEADSLQKSAVEPEEKALQKEAYNDCLLHFSAYLKNLVHVFDVQEKTIKDRLTYQQNPQMDFQGIDLETANGLYITYSRELHSLEADLAQKEFIIQQLGQPEFEISSINAIMDDSISREIINKTSSLMLILKDEPNRTTKELERLRRDVDIQKGFLIVHLKQMCDILRLRELLLEDKIHALQNMTLELIRQKISIQEKHLNDFINSRLNNLKHERDVIVQHQNELQQELDLLPEKWASQKLIDQHMQSNLNIVHQIASMIESKTIAENLEVSQSAPFDEAITPVLPRDPKLLLFAAIGTLGGAFISFCFCLVQSAGRGVEATSENLNTLHQHVSGYISLKANSENIENLSHSDLETLRRLIVYLAPQDEQSIASNRILLIEGHGPQYAEVFAALMAKRGLKILLLPLSFNEQSLEGASPGLLDVLEGKASYPKILKGLYYDRIASGGYSPFSNELLESGTFKSLLEKFSTEYSWVIGYTDALPVSAAAESLLQLFSKAAVTLDGENLEQLSQYFDANREGHTVSFLFKTHLAR